MTPVRTGPVVVLGDAPAGHRPGRVGQPARTGRAGAGAGRPGRAPAPGRGGLAAQLLALDGHEVVLVTALSADEAAERLLGALHPAVRVIAVPHSGRTTVKQRIRAAGQSLLRWIEGAAVRSARCRTRPRVRSTAPGRSSSPTTAAASPPTPAYASC
jgi:hypothetical protein